MKNKFNNKRFFFFFFLFTTLATAQYTSYDWNSRDKWMKIDDFFDLVQIEKGLKVADIGCHEGYLTLHLAKRVGANGAVYAVDVNKYRLEKLKKHTIKEKLKNITTVLGDYDNPKLPQNALDIVFVIDSYHEMTSYEKMLKHFYSSLLPNGKLVLLEKIKKHKIGKSRREQTDAHTLSLAYVKKELVEAGFSVEYEVPNFGYWERDKTKQMWILIAKKP
ncbi:MAG: methyltransferase domain-containing protein [Flavobacteriaceae bacterium]|nr:methyltransferase domain-containing protein [Flavobacteriaceae bacterium]